MPCGHNFCKGCLDAKFAGQADSVQGGSGYRPLRTRKVRGRGGGAGRLWELRCVQAEQSEESV